VKKKAVASGKTREMKYTGGSRKGIHKKDGTKGKKAMTLAKSKKNDQKTGNEGEENPL